MGGIWGQKSGCPASRLLFFGRAERPTIAYLNNGKVELIDAGGIWELNIPKAIEKLKEKFGDGLQKPQSYCVQGKTNIEYYDPK